MRLEVLQADLKRILENQEYQKDKLQKLDEILRGNGDPSKGVVVRLALVEQSHKDLKADRRRNLTFAATAVLGFCGSLALLVIRVVWGV